VTAMVWAVYGALVLSNLGSLVHLLVRHPEIRPRRLYSTSASLRVVIRQSGVLFALSIAVASSYMFDNLLTLHWLGATASAQMTMVLRVCTTSAGMIAVVTQPLWPAFVEAESVRDQKWAISTLVRGTIMVAIVALCGAIFVVVAGAPLLAWWLGSDIGIRPDMLWAAGTWIVVMCTPRVAALLLSAALVLRYQLAAAAAALVLAFVLKFVFAERFGAAGILSATSFSWLLIIWPAYTFLTLRWCAKPSLQSNRAPAG
jgi:O-antigen/teichoic acid export membrane protein